MGKTIRGRKGKPKNKLQSKKWHPRGGLIPPTKHFSSVKDYKRKRDGDLDIFLEDYENDDRSN